MTVRARLLGAALVAAALGSAAWAEATPDRGRHDPRVRVAHYVDGQVYRIATTILNVTTVEFGPGETIASIVAGDTEGFLLDGVPGGRAFAVKPVAPGARTNITVYTNQRSYYFHVVEADEPTFFVVRFAYPEAAAPTQAATRPPSSTRYGVTGATEFAPVAISDDGTFTYFQFAPSAPFPAILRVGRDGGERTVNSTVQPNGIVRVSGLSAAWVLRLGDDVVCVEALPPEGSS